MFDEFGGDEIMSYDLFMEKWLSSISPSYQEEFKTDLLKLIRKERIEQEIQTWYFSTRYHVRLPKEPSGGGPAYNSRYEVSQLVFRIIDKNPIHRPRGKWISYEISLGELFENQYNERWAEENLQWMRNNKNLN